MEKRVMGCEIEWAGIERTVSGARHWQELTDASIQAVLTWARQFVPRQYEAHYYMPNGGSIYRESVSGLVETTTPGCLLVQDLVVYEKWWEKFLQKGVEEILRDRNLRIMFHKKNSDFTDVIKITAGQTKSDSSALGISEVEAYLHGSTRGCHENYLVESELMRSLRRAAPNYYLPPELQEKPLVGQKDTAKANFLILFLITRQIITGAGGIKFIRNENNVIRPRFVISPRVLHINKNFCQGTTADDNRGILDTMRDESHTNLDCYRRLHLLIGDSNMSELSIFLKLGMTQAVLEMLEEGFWKEDEMLKLRKPYDAVRLMKEISFDRTCQGVEITLADNTIQTAIGIQKRFCELFGRYLEKLERKPGKFMPNFDEKLQVSRLWSQVLQNLETGSPSSARQLDWKIKYRWLGRYCGKEMIKLSDPKAKAFDLSYHSIDPEQSLFFRLDDAGEIDHILPPEIVGRITEIGARPPENTRAQIRCELMARLECGNIDHKVLWHSISCKVIEPGKYPGDFDSFRYYHIYLEDPFLASVNDIPDVLSENTLRLLKKLKI